MEALFRFVSGVAAGIAAQFSDAPLFRWLRRYVHRRIRKEAGDE